MSEGRGQRSVTLSADDVERFRACAEARGMSLAAWLAEAGRGQRLREAAAQYAEWAGQPEIAEQLAAWHAAAPAFPKYDAERAAAA